MIIIIVLFLHSAQFTRYRVSSLVFQWILIFYEAACVFESQEMSVRNPVCFTGMIHLFGRMSSCLRIYLFKIRECKRKRKRKTGEWGSLLHEREQQLSQFSVLRHTDSRWEVITQSTEATSQSCGGEECLLGVLGLMWTIIWWWAADVLDPEDVGHVPDPPVADDAAVPCHDGDEIGDLVLGQVGKLDSIVTEDARLSIMKVVQINLSRLSCVL